MMLLSIPRAETVDWNFSAYRNPRRIIRLCFSAYRKLRPIDEVLDA